jgi:hypothetical protein
MNVLFQDAHRELIRPHIEQLNNEEELLLWMLLIHTHDIELATPLFVDMPTVMRLEAATLRGAAQTIAGLWPDDKDQQKTNYVNWYWNYELKSTNTEVVTPDKADQIQELRNRLESDPRVKAVILKESAVHVVPSEAEVGLLKHLSEQRMSERWVEILHFLLAMPDVKVGYDEYPPNKSGRWLVGEVLVRIRRLLRPEALSMWQRVGHDFVGARELVQQLELMSPNEEVLGFAPHSPSANLTGRCYTDTNVTRLIGCYWLGKLKF